MVTVPAKLLTDAKDAIEELLEFIAMAEFSYSTGRKIPAKVKKAWETWAGFGYNGRSR
jgi:hypothetical protein